MKKNILLITARADIGGGPKHVYELAKELSRKHADKMGLFIASPQDRPYFSKYLKLCIDHLLLPHRSFSLFSFLKLIIFCLKNKIDIIHSHGRGAGLYSRPLKLMGIKIIHSHHGIHPVYPFKNFIEKMLSYGTDLHILVSKSEYAMGKKLHLFTESHAIIINNGISCRPPEKGNKSPYDLRKKFKIKENDRCLVSLSRLDKHKGNHLLIEKFSQLIKKEGNHFYKLLIAGDGEERENLQRLIQKLHLQNHITLLGNSDRPQELLSIADLYVGHSQGEGLPYSILEAFAATLPCLLSDVSGHQGLVGPEQLFPSNNAKIFCEKVPFLIKQRKIGLSNNERLKQDFSLDKQIEKLMIIYNKIGP